MNNPQARLIKRKFEIIPRLYDLDLQCVVYNVNYFTWFDEARLQIILEMISFDEIMETGYDYFNGSAKIYSSSGVTFVNFDENTKKKHEESKKLSEQIKINI